MLMVILVRKSSIATITITIAHWKTRQVSSTLQHALVSMLVTSVTTAAGDISIINQLNVVIIFIIFVQTGPNLQQIYVLAVSSIIACATLHSITRAITWKRRFQEKHLKEDQNFLQRETYHHFHNDHIAYLKSQKLKMTCFSLFWQLRVKHYGH